MLPPHVVSRGSVLFQNSGNDIGTAELSHRSAEYQSIHESCLEKIRDLLNVPTSHEVLLVPGGATMQFALLPMNLLGKSERSSDKLALYVLSGSWSKKAYEHAQNIVGIKVSSVDTKERDGIMNTEQLQAAQPDLEGSKKLFRYIHVTSNNTIKGTQFAEKDFPSGLGIPLVTDASSDIMSRAIEWNKHGVVYAGAQKNLGIAGVAVVIIRKDWLDLVNGLAPILDYNIHAEKKSCYNTPPTFSIAIMNLVLEWVQSNGGVAGMSQLATQRAKLVYNALMEREDAFELAVKSSGVRSLMNLTFLMKNDDSGEKTKKFLAAASESGLVGLKGHRSVGGMRASMYNAMPIQGAEALANFIQDWKE